MRALVLPSLLLTACATSRPEPPWQPLFDGRTLNGWDAIEFGGEGSVTVEDGRLILAQGATLTGVRWAGPPLPASGYELELTAARRSGTDFFCGLTFPVGANHCTLIVGGWGGSLLGLSCVDGEDAAHNATGQAVGFEQNRAYRIHLRVDRRAIRVWLDDEPRIDLDLRRHLVSVRADVSLTIPLAVTSYATESAVADVRWRPLDDSLFGKPESTGPIED